MYETDNGSSARAIPIDKQVHLGAHHYVSGTIGPGWDQPTDWGIWMKSTPASIRVGFDGPAIDDVSLFLEGRTRSRSGGPPVTIAIRFNDADLGIWSLPRETRQLRHRFIVPKTIFNRSTVADLTFSITGGAPPEKFFGVGAISLRDVRRLSGFKGALDHCSKDALSGWAVADGSPISVTASVNGQPLNATFFNVERADLSNHGLPVEAGFILRLKSPIPSGSTVDVRFANGRPLPGSPCRP